MEDLTGKYKVMFDKITTHLDQVGFTSDEKKLFRELAPNIPDINRWINYFRVGSKFAGGSFGLLVKASGVIIAGGVIMAFAKGFFSK